MTVGLLNFAITPQTSSLLSPLASQRNVVNMNFPYINDYAFIDHIKNSSGGISPYGATFASPGSPTFSALIDANGWPNDTRASGQTFGGGIQVPTSANFGGPYVLTWQGDGAFNFTSSTPVWTEQAGSINYTKTSNGHWKNVPGSNPYIILAVSGIAAAGTYNFNITSTGGPAATGNTTSGNNTLTGMSSISGIVANQAITGPGIPSNTTVVSVSGTSVVMSNNATAPGTGVQLQFGTFMTGLKFYRQADETDLLAGKVYRAAFKQQLVNLNPSAVRFMNQIGRINTGNCRFENRTKPGNAGYGYAANWVASPVYGDLASGSFPNQYTLAAATPTASNPQTTPNPNTSGLAAHVHGEMVLCRTQTAQATVRPASCTVSNITNSTTPQATVVALATPTGTTASGSNVINGPAPTGNTTSGNNTLTGMSSISGIVTGAAISAAGIPANTTVVSASGTSVVMSNNATVTSSGAVQIQFGLATSGIAAGQNVSATGIPSGLTVVSVNSNAGTVVMSGNATANGAGTITFGHSFQVGDRVYFTYPLNGGSSGIPIGMMTAGLQYFPVTVASVIDATNFTISGFDTTSSPAYTAVTKDRSSVIGYTSLAVGGRDEYPVCYVSPIVPFLAFGSISSSASQNKTFYFDKNAAGRQDGSGNWVFGVWKYIQDQSSGGHTGDLPIEVAVALVNELNDMSVAQGINNPISMWLNIPSFGMRSTDPDYSSASSWILNAYDIVMNPSSTVRTSGFSALRSQASLLIEDSNETWNGAFLNTGAMYATGYQRWPLTGNGVNNPVDYIIFRAVNNVRDVRSVYGIDPRVKFSMGGQGSNGYATNANPRLATTNYLRMNAQTTDSTWVGYFYTNDSVVLSQGWGSPLQYFDAFHFATYFDPASAYMSGTTGTGNYKDDTAMFNGTDNSPSGGGNYTGAANPSQAITNFVASISASTSGGGITQYTTLAAQYSTNLGAQGKVAISYEGGADWADSGTAGQIAFTQAVYNSSQWATAQIGYWTTAVAGNSNYKMPSVYTYIGVGTSTRWAYCEPDSYGSTSTEGQALANNPTFAAMCTRNQALML